MSELNSNNDNKQNDVFTPTYSNNNKLQSTLVEDKKDGLRYRKDLQILLGIIIILILLLFIFIIYLIYIIYVK